MANEQAIYNPSLDTTIDVYCGRANNNTLIGNMSLRSIYNTLKTDNPSMKGLVIGGKKDKTGYQDFTLLFPVAGTAYHIGDSNLNGSTSGTMYWVFFQTTSTPSNKRYFYEANGTLTSTTVSFSTETIDGITYYKNDFYRANSVPPIFITESDIQPLYINGELSVQTYTSNGGGATHIAKVTGQLKDLSSNLSDILMVSGGGGGGLLVGETDYSGKEAGGISGSGDNSADQSTGNAFGQGESGTNVSGGGSGLYGGYKGTSSKSGGAGSGYIGNSLISNKKMVGYNVPTSSAEATKTESVNDVSANPVSGKPKIGNGFAKIKYLGEGKIFDISAENQLKDSVNNKSPQVIYGSIGTYDSNTQSYYFSSSCYLGYDSKITKTQIQRATKIKIESVVKTDSTVVGESVDTEVGISTSASSVYTFDYAIVGIICNGIESSVSKHIAKLNYEDYSWQGDAPEDVSGNQGAFHTIIHEFTLLSGTVTKIKVTIDGILFAEASPDVALSLSNDDYYFVVGVCDKTNIKSVKVVIG